MCWYKKTDPCVLPQQLFCTVLQFQCDFSARQLSEAISPTMQVVLGLALCFVSAYCAGLRRVPNFDCDRHCKKFGSTPMCSTEANTFENECYLKCKWEYKECDGKCPCRVDPPPPQVVYYKPSKCWCKPEYDPVCCTDGETYDNKCEAECEGKRIWYESRCL